MGPRRLALSYHRSTFTSNGNFESWIGCVARALCSRLGCGIATMLSWSAGEVSLSDSSASRMSRLTADVDCHATFDGVMGGDPFAHQEQDKSHVNENDADAPAIELETHAMSGQQIDQKQENE
jgi:hypothetical protein